MSDAPYLVALALIEQEGSRAMPLGGKSLRPGGEVGEEPGSEGRELVLELLLRLWQRTDEGGLRRAAGAESLLLVQLPLECLTEQVPARKAEWIRSGDTAGFLGSLASLAIRGWTVSVPRRQPVTFAPWPAVPERRA